MTNLKKLISFKPWLSLPDAARHLSILFGEDVSEAHVLRLGLDRHLTLSVDFVNHACGRPGRLAANAHYSPKAFSTAARSSVVGPSLSIKRRAWARVLS